MGTRRDTTECSVDKPLRRLMGPYCFMQDRQISFPGDSFPPRFADVQPIEDLMCTIDRLVNQRIDLYVWREDIILCQGCDVSEATMASLDLVNI